MILGFKIQFKDLILSGSKIHTVRGDKHDRWQPGKIIHFVIGARTKNYNQFKIGKCISTQFISIEKKEFGQEIGIDGQYLFPSEMMTLAKNDGFDSIERFLDFFPGDFSGKIIHWTDFKY